MVVVFISEAGVCITKRWSKGETDNRCFAAKLLEINEWEAPESNNMSAGLVFIVHVPSTTSESSRASSAEMWCTRPGRDGLTALGLLPFHAGQSAMKWPGCPHLKQVPLVLQSSTLGRYLYMGSRLTSSFFGGVHAVADMGGRGVGCHVRGRDEVASC